MTKDKLRSDEEIALRNKMVLNNFPKNADGFRIACAYNPMYASNSFWQNRKKFAKYRNRTIHKELIECDDFICKIFHYTGKCDLEINLSVHLTLIETNLIGRSGDCEEIKIFEDKIFVFIKPLIDDKYPDLLTYCKKNKINCVLYQEFNKGINSKKTEIIDLFKVNNIRVIDVKEIPQEIDVYELENKGWDFYQ